MKYIFKLSGKEMGILWMDDKSLPEICRTKTIERSFKIDLLRGIEFETRDGCGGDEK